LNYKVLDAIRSRLDGYEKLRLTVSNITLELWEKGITSPQDAIKNGYWEFSSCEKKGEVKKADIPYAAVRFMWQNVILY